VALRRNLAQSLIEHETISTTVQKAKEIKPFVEKLITLAKKGKLEHRRRAIALLGNRDIVSVEDGQSNKTGTVVGKLFSELGPRYLNRPGGYTRIIRLAMRRLGDNGELVLLQLLGEDEPIKKAKKVSSKRAAARKAKAAPKAKAVSKEAKAELAEAAPEVVEESQAEAPVEEPQQDEETKE
jgi:large subunit ribosomal protein L17